MPQLSADIRASLKAALDRKAAQSELRTSAVVIAAEAFGAIGLMINTPGDVAPMLKKAFDTAGPVIVGVHVDYTDNHRLFEMVRGDNFH